MPDASPVIDTAELNDTLDNCMALDLSTLADTMQLLMSRTPHWAGCIYHRPSHYTREAWLMAVAFAAGRTHGINEAIDMLSQPDAIFETLTIDTVTEEPEPAPTTLAGTPRLQ